MGVVQEHSRRVGDQEGDLVIPDIGNGLSKKRVQKTKIYLVLAVVGVMVGMSVLVVSSIYILSVREATARAICAGQIENRNAIRRVILRAKSLTVEDVDSQRFYRAVLDEDVPQIYCDNSGVPSEAPREEP